MSQPLTCWYARVQLQTAKWTQPVKKQKMKQKKKIKKGKTTMSPTAKWPTSLCKRLQHITLLLVRLGPVCWSHKSLGSDKLCSTVMFYSFQEQIKPVCWRSYCWFWNRLWLSFDILGCIQTRIEMGKIVRFFPSEHPGIWSSNGQGYSRDRVEIDGRLTGFFWGRSSSRCSFRRRQVWSVI